MPSIKKPAGKLPIKAYIAGFYALEKINLAEEYRIKVFQ